MHFWLVKLGQTPVKVIVAIANYIEPVQIDLWHRRRRCRRLCCRIVIVVCKRAGVFCVTKKWFILAGVYFHLTEWRFTHCGPFTASYSVVEFNKMLPVALGTSS